MARVSAIHRNFRTCEILLPGHTLTLSVQFKDGKEFPSYKGPSPERVATYLQSCLPGDKVAIGTLSGEPENEMDIAVRETELNKNLKKQNRIFAISYPLFSAWLMYPVLTHHPKFAPYPSPWHVPLELFPYVAPPVFCLGLLGVCLLARRGKYPSSQETGAIAYRIAQSRPTLRCTGSDAAH